MLVRDPPMRASVLPPAPDGLLPPPAVLDAWLAAHGGESISLEEIPADHLALPSFCRRQGIRQITLTAPLPFPPSFRWVGADGAEILMLAPGAAPGEDPPQHRGPLPTSPTRLRSTRRAWAELLAAQQLADAASAIAGPGRSFDASFSPLLDALAGRPPSAPPPLAAQQDLPADADSLTIWNPAPWARTCTLLLDARAADLPWSLRDARGRRHAVQVVDGPLGRQLLARIPMQELACAQLTLDSQPASDRAWEVSTRVLDNGRLRAEFDTEGRLSRLCVDGRFCALSGPALALPGPGPSQVSVLEDGPVRARLLVERGDRRLVCSLHGDETCLDLHLTGSDDACWLELPTRIEVGLFSAWQAAGVPLLASLHQRLDAPAPSCDGCQAVALAAPGEATCELTVLGLGGTTVECQGGLMRLAASGGLRFQIGLGLRAEEITCRAAWHRVDARCTPLPGDQPPLLVLDQPNRLCPAWIRQDETGMKELLLLERCGRAGSVSLRPMQASTTMQTMQVRDGGAWRELPRDREAGWWRLDFQAGEVLPIKWTRS